MATVCKRCKMRTCSGDCAQSGLGKAVSKVAAALEPSRTLCAGRCGQMVIVRKMKRFRGKMWCVDCHAGAV